jgi:uncharacterized protein YkwD
MGIGRILLGLLIVGGLIAGVVTTDILGGNQTAPADGADTPEPTDVPEATDKPEETAETTSPTDQPSTTTATATATTTRQTASQSISAGDVTYHLRNEVNRVREDKAKSELNREPILDDMARRHAKNMAANSYVGHVQPDGTTLADRYDAAGLSCTLSTGQIAGENLLRIQPSTDDEQEIAKQIVQSWMDDPDAREKLLANYLGEQGIGVAVTDRGTVYVVQNFC